MARSNAKLHVSWPVQPHIQVSIASIITSKRMYRIKGMSRDDNEVFKRRKSQQSQSAIQNGHEVEC